MATQPELDLWANENATVPSLVTVKETGRILAISRSTVYELIAARQLQVVHIGRSVRIPLDAIAAYVASLRQPEV